MTDSDNNNTESNVPMVNRRQVLGSLAVGAIAASAAQADSAVPKAMQGQVALITGAARGIGRSIALAYARLGADVVLVDIADSEIYEKTIGYALASDADLQETVALLKQSTGRVLSIKADVSDEAAMNKAVAETVKKFGRLDVFVANAGIAAQGSMVEMPSERWNTVIDINLKGVANGLRAALPQMQKQQYGRVINIASVLGRQGSAGLSAYCASKWGVIGMTKAAALEVGKQGITVNAIAPSGVKTGIWGQMLEQPEMMAGLDARLQTKHALDVGLMEPDDIADAAVYLASAGAKMISGMVVDVAAGANAAYTA